MAGGKIKGISKKEGGDIKKFEWGQRRGEGTVRFVKFLSLWAGVPAEKGRDID